MRVQKFEDKYPHDFQCIGCDKAVRAGQFYLVVRQRDNVDTDPELACHLTCLDKVGEE